jgi:hypothetical protein
MHRSKSLLSLHGVLVELTATTSLITRLQNALEYKGAGALDGDADLDADVRMAFHYASTEASFPQARLLARSEAGINVYLRDEGYVLSDGHSTVDVVPDEGRATGVINSEASSDEAVHFLASMSLVLILRHLGYYVLHTAAAAESDTSLLIIGPSDTGKSTTALNLVRSGWDYVSDDSVLLHLQDDAVTALSFRRDFCLDAAAADVFPPLATHEWASPPNDPVKWRVELDRLLPGRYIPSCQPNVLLFPRLCDSGPTRLSSISALEAFEIAADQSIMGLAADAAGAMAHIEMIGRLISQCDSYRLLLGPDALSDPGLVSSLLAEALPPNVS